MFDTEDDELERRRAASRARAEQAIARANLTLAQPEGPFWWEQPPARGSPGGPLGGATTATSARGGFCGVTRTALSPILGHYERALGDMFAAEQLRAEWRYREFERRLDELEKCDGSS